MSELRNSYENSWVVVLCEDASREIWYLIQWIEETHPNHGQHHQPAWGVGGMRIRKRGTALPATHLSFSKRYHSCGCCFLWRSGSLLRPFDSLLRLYSEGTPDCQPQIGVPDEVSEIEECRVLTQVGEMPHSIPSPWPVLALASLFWFNLEDNNRSGALRSEVWYLSWSGSSVYWLCVCGLGFLVSQLGIIIAFGVFLRTEMGMRNTKHIAWGIVKRQEMRYHFWCNRAHILFHSISSALTLGFLVLIPFSTFFRPGLSWVLAKFLALRLNSIHESFSLGRQYLTDSHVYPAWVWWPGKYKDTVWERSLTAMALTICKTSWTFPKTGHRAIYLTMILEAGKQRGWQ